MTSRRGFLTGARAEFRPPFTTEARLARACSGCGACVKACPEGILQTGPGGLPRLKPGLGECTFCRACVTACPEDVFAEGPPWEVTARLTGSCLLTAGISCRLCSDACPNGALRFDAFARPVGAIAIGPDCTGCGACLIPCPQAALTLHDPRQEART